MNKGNMDTIRQKKTYQGDKWKLQDPLSPTVDPELDIGPK